MIEWEEFKLTKEKGKALNLDDFQETDDRFYIELYVFTNFGGVCNKDEIEQITEIVYNAYKREKNS